uniref:Uncharacterized protein n=1 Tax=Anguilla anguilla TaxID=7936 RepID=A0A0E9RG98_ANGAN
MLHFYHMVAPMTTNLNLGLLPVISYPLAASSNAVFL